MGETEIGFTDMIPSVMFASQSAALAPRKEVPSLIPGSSSRPADIYLPNWDRGRPVALDVTVISTLQLLTLSGAAHTQGHALQIGEKRKMAAHKESCHAVGVSFTPMVIESLGGWSEIASHNISRIGRLMGQRSGSPPSESTRHLFQRLSITLVAGKCQYVAKEAPHQLTMGGWEHVTLLDSGSFLCGQTSYVNCVHNVFLFLFYC